MEGCWSNHMKGRIKDNCAAISVYFKEWAVRAVALPSPSSCVLISLSWTERIDCRGWASLDMSFKTPMPSHCSIFIHLQVSNRPSGQHIVSLPVSSALDGTYVVDRNNMKPPASHPAFSSPLSSSPLFYSSSLFLSSPFRWMPFWQFIYFCNSKPCLPWIGTSESAIYRVCFSHLHVVNDDKPSL